MRFLKAYRFRRDNVHQRTALCTGEYGLVYGVGKFFFAQYHAAPWPAQRLMGSRRHNVGIRHGVHVQPHRRKACNVSHIHHEEGARLIGYFAEFLIVYLTRVRRRARNDQLRSYIERLFAHLVVIYALRLGIEAVGIEGIVLTGHIDGASVSKMAAVGKIHAQHLITGLKQREVYCEVGARAAVGLYVGVLRAEKLAGAVPRDILHHVHIFAAAVVTLIWIPFGIFICKMAAHGCHHRRRHKIFRGYKLYVSPLPQKLIQHRFCNVGRGLSYNVKLYHGFTP